MKKIIAFLLSLISIICVFSSCGKKEEEVTETAFDPDSYVGEGLLTIFGNLVDQNQTFVNEVFIYSHLAVDENNTKEVDGKTYIKVTDKYSTLDELKEAMNKVYTEQATDNILTQYNYYIDIDGELYFEKSAESNIIDDTKKVFIRDYSKSAEFIDKGDYTYTMAFSFENEKKTTVKNFVFYRMGTNSYKLGELTITE